MYSGYSKEDGNYAFDLFMDRELSGVIGIFRSSLDFYPGTVPVEFFEPS